MKKLLETLTIVERYQGEKRVLVRPGVSAVLYSDVSTPRMASSVADAVAEYLAFIKPATLQTFLGNNGYHKPLSDRQIAKDLKILRNMPADYEDYRLRYSDSATGDAGTHEIYFESYLDSRNEKKKGPETNPFRMEFPFDVLDQAGVEEFIAFLIRIAEMLPFQSGNAGYAFQRDMTHERDAALAVVRLLPRYHGFDPSYAHASLRMKDRTPSAHWINLLNRKMVAKLGGVKAVKAALPAADIREFETGVLIRSAKTPPIGDVNRRSPDIGCLPDTARLLRPLRVELAGLGLPRTTFDAMAWLARFDTMESKDWNQR